MNRIRLFISIGIMAIIVFASGRAIFAATYSDVKSDHWAYSTVEWAVKNNIVAGYDDYSRPYPRGAYTLRWRTLEW